MIGDLKPYAEYKDSGLPSLGGIPAHWLERRAKYFFREVDERSESGNEVLMSVSHKTGVTPRKQSVTMFLAESTVGYKICRPGDIAINTMWAFMGALGIARQEGIVSPSYGVYRSKRAGMLNSEYLDGLLRADAYKTEYIRRSTGINSSRLRLYPDQFLRIPLICPPPDEQEAIAHFLAWANSQLELAIRAKRKVITLLNEQKQAIIHRAVTCGLDPSVPHKASGIPWLGDIPAHWAVGTIGSVSELIQTGPFGSQLHSHEYVADGIPVINPSHMADGCINPSATVSITAGKAQELSRHKLCSGDVVIARRGELGRCAIVTNSEEGWICGTGSLLLRCKMLVNPDYFQMVFSSKGIADMLSLSSIGATMANLNASVVARQWMPIPPLEEQEAIVPFARGETKKVNTAISRLEREIELLREYRTRLVADVVTGKLDVREAAVRLPNEELPPDLAAADDEPDDLPNEEEDDA